jgi:AcrR family transcriptional regulator
MDDLAAELGMSKKTLYAHFRSKPALVEAAIAEKFNELEADLRRIEAACAADFPGALHEMLTCLRRHAEEIRDPFVRDVRRSAPDLFKSIEARRSAIVQRYFGRLFANGRKAEMVRKDVPAPLALEILLGAIQAIVNPPKLAELGLTPQAAIPAVISVILDGLLTAAGRRSR